MKNQFVITFIFLLIGSPLLAGGNGGGGGVRPNNKPTKIDQNTKFISTLAGGGGGGGGVRPSNKLAQSNQNPNYFSSFAAGNQRGTIDSARTVLVETEVSQAIGGGGSGGGGVLDSLSSEANAGVGGSTTGSKIAGGALGFNPLNKKMTGHEV